jgi:hypothetical protein
LADPALNLAPLCYASHAFLFWRFATMILVFFILQGATRHDPHSPVADVMRENSSARQEQEGATRRVVVGCGLHVGVNRGLENWSLGPFACDDGQDMNIYSARWWSWVQDSSLDVGPFCLGKDWDIGWRMNATDETKVTITTCLYGAKLTNLTPTHPLVAMSVWSRLRRWHGSRLRLGQNWFVHRERQLLPQWRAPTSSAPYPSSLMLHTTASLLDLP